MNTKLFVFPKLLNHTYFAYAWECLNLEVRTNNSNIVLLDYNESFGIPEITSDTFDGFRENWISQVQSEFGKKLSVEKVINPLNIDTDLNMDIFLQLDKGAQRSLKSIAATQVFNCLHFSFFPNLFNELQPYYKSYVSTKVICEDAITRYKPLEIILLNGRWPDQVAVTEIARKFNLTTNHIEAGFPLESRWFYEKFQTSDLNLIDNYLKSSSKNIKEEKDLEHFATTWASRQANSVTENVYLKNQTKVKTHKRMSSPTCTIFTSSIDEFYSNLPFEDFGWGTQENGIKSIVERLNIQNYVTTVRLHPNLGNKSWVDVISTYMELGKLRCRLVYPWEFESSYGLVDNSDLVITWGSTIGLEAAFRGKKVAFFGPTIYRSLLRAEQLTPKNLVNFHFSEIDPIEKSNAIEAIYMSRNWGRFISDTNPFKPCSFDCKILELHENSFKLKAMANFNEILKIFRGRLRTSPNQTHHYLLKVFGKKLSSRIMVLLVELLAIALRKRILTSREFL